MVHSRYKYAGKLPDNFNAEKIYFSLVTPIENIDDMGILLSGVDAGFCSYKASFDTPFTGDNITYIGMSSGKTTVKCKLSGISLIRQTAYSGRSVCGKAFNRFKRFDALQNNRQSMINIALPCFYNTEYRS
ncbi:MAG: hypothetical protein WBI53_04045 [Paludibacter sp.]